MGRHNKPPTRAELQAMVANEFANAASDPAVRAELLGNAVQNARELRESLRDESGA
ncbi:hypothetical protein [Actinocrispum wychmicini]|uniref:Uncharacterized protein n=1 Tax=Actinocrispum wychmicini TaxID=1213861 RepID=A0A4R2K512_9PSEU|nr:hypothetical protein [Actinocrispum wychmicini]TCO64916.1 hypothetical protein EV192_101700 [Actinocrispum wychmicini]